jgi:hypothetical protein
MLNNNTPAKAKLIYNKTKETYTVVVAFNVTQQTDRGTYVFPTRKKCAYVSGEFVYSTFTQDLKRILELAKSILRTDTIVIVE